MGKKKDQPKSWADKLSFEDAMAEDSAAAVAKQVDKDVLASLTEQVPLTVTPEEAARLATAHAPMLELAVLKARYIDLEIRNKELELGLYLAKAKICELELEKLRTKKEG